MMKKSSRKRAQRQQRIDAKARRLKGQLENERVFGRWRNRGRGTDHAPQRRVIVPSITSAAGLAAMMAATGLATPSEIERDRREGLLP